MRLLTERDCFMSKKPSSIISICNMLLDNMQMLVEYTTFPENTATTNPTQGSQNKQITQQKPQQQQQKPNPNTPISARANPSTSSSSSSSSASTSSSNSINSKKRVNDQLVNEDNQSSEGDEGSE